ncbi:hypothetical protein BASA50_008687 [Batrachochytrium salamandrivorans]|uniref:Protein kinase domain-containing protein n=1 Tax=Batrachochytrium salamandrivorans TaxID=1357716 RepID=A0ABQ8F3H6_9FUNG|nr:hypothetical protein BASA50_008687 [Batrachochytrium salamandrivorans]
MCSQQQSPPGPQLSTLHDPPQSDKMPLPVRVGKLEVKSYIQSWETDQYIAFTKEETRYFESEYSSKKKLGKGKSGVVYLATRKSDGMEVAYKSIPKSKTRKYASESNTFTRCHLRNPIVRSKKPSVEQCMSPRPPDPLVPYEFMIQRYLSRPGYKNPYVSVVFDYFILESEYIVVMEYCDEQWENLAKYVRERIRLDIENARNIVREIVNAMISLKRHGVVHNYLTGHYGSLAADTTGHSLDLQYWHDRQPIQVSRDTLTIRNSDILDQDFSWNQIVAALLQMSPRKAPGDDGITTAFYQAALYMLANTQEGVPPTPFARALLRVCGQVFASATIPRAWLCASIVSIDKKYGDPLNPGDKRGIALINVGLKLVCNVLQMRIERFAETKNLLSYEQAGLRKREECVGQVVSPVDIIQRRQNAGLNTHVLFIDIRKAFDTVTVGALLWKLQNMGFPRRTLAFLKALYTFSSARARAGSLLSDPFPVQRGVRQGCPLSGLLFNLFINDILDGVAPITVPGLP